jgi:hypothetical protein
MTFVSDIPVSGDSLGSTRDRIRGNFQEIAAVEAINHVAFNQVGKGKHTFLQMPEQVSAPTTLANEAGFYSKVGTNPAESNLFFRGENNGFEYQLTRADQTNIATFSNNTAYVANHLGGWTFLPGGLIMQYGTRTTTTATGTITFPRAFTTAVYSINLSFSRVGGTTTQQTRIESFNSATLTGFDFSSTSANNTPITWMAIGK